MYFCRAVFIIFLVLLGCRPDREQQAKSSVPTGEEENTHQPLLNSLGDTIPTGVEIPVLGKVFSVDEIMDVTVVPAGEPKIIPAHPNVIEFDKLTKRNIPVNLEKLPRLSSGDITNPLALVNSVGDTIPTGIPVPARGRKLPVKWSEPLPALPPRYLDNASVDIKYIDVEHGMGSNYVHGLLKDSRGYFWFSTYGGGIDLYDGVSFRNFSVEEGLSSSIVFDIMEDRSGRIWFGTPKGLSYLDGQDLVQFHDRDGYASSEVHSMLQDDEGNLWFGSSKYGLSKFDGQSFYYFGEKEGCKAKNIIHLELDSRGNIWIGDHEHGLIKFNGVEFTYYCEKGGLPRIPIRAIKEDIQGNLWLGTGGNGVIIYDGKQFNQYSNDHLLRIDIIDEDRYGNIWFSGVDKGIFKFDGTTISRINAEQGLVNSRIQDIIIDDFGKVWIATYGGVSIYNPHSFQHPKPLSQMDFRSIFRDSKNNIWFGTEDYGVFKYDGRNYYHFAKEQGLSCDGVRITAISEDNKGNLWFGTESFGSEESGLIKFDGQLNATSSRNKMASFTYYVRKGSNTVSSLAVDKLDNVWIGYMGKDILRFDGEVFFQITPDESMRGKFLLNRLIEDYHGDLWVRTTPGGVIKIALGLDSGQPITSTHFSAREGITNNPVANVVPDRQGNIWIMDYYGYVYRNKGEAQSGEYKMFNRIDLGKIQEDKYVQSIMQDEDDRIWLLLTSSSGLDLLALDPEENYLPALSASYGKQDGLKKLNVILPFLDNDRIWLSMGNGISQLDLRHFWHSAPSPEIYLNEIQINEQYHDFRNLEDSMTMDFEFDSVYRFSNAPVNLQLPHNQKDLTFFFSVLEWSAPHQIRYSYFLEGISKDWSAPDEAAYVNFQRLPHGDYTLKARAYGKSKQWSDTLSYSFVIYPPWWLTWWAKGLYVVIFALAIFGIIRLRTQNLKKQRKKLEETIETRTSELKVANESAKAAILQRDERDLELRAFLERMPIAACMVDQEGNMYYHNSRFIESFGYSHDEISRLADWWVLAYPDEDYRQWVIETWSEYVRRSQESGTDIEAEEYKVTCKDGTIREMEISGIAVGDRYLATLIDNTERNRINDELRYAKETAEGANQAKSIFLANMSHELRTPLNAVLGFTKLMAHDENLTTQQHERLKLINRSGIHLLGMIGDILTLSRIEAGRVDLREEIFNFHQMLEDIERIFRSRAEGKGLLFNVQLGNEFPDYFTGDVGKLRQVLFNLLDNAVKYTEKGGISLRASGEIMKEDNEKLMLILEVKDSGTGIPQDKLDEIFESFVRVDHPNQMEPGTGLGLSISKSLIDLLGGELNVESEVGRGTSFKLNIPIRISEDENIKQEEPDLPDVIGLLPEQPDWRILVVDDNRENLMVLMEMLERVGFKIKGVANGMEAISMFEEWQPQLILMDVRMPGMDGYEATAKIRALPGGDEVKIVAVTASVIEDPEKVIRETGIDDVVLKPFRDQEIFEVMARELGVEYIYRDKAEVMAGPREIKFNTTMLAELPTKLIQELKQTTMVANRDATLEVIERIETIAPETAASLRTLVENYRIGRIHELLTESEKKHGS